MALLSIDRTKTLLHRRRARLPTIGERDQDVIPFVSLHVFQVLYEYGLALFLHLLAITVYEVVVSTKAPQLLLDEIALLPRWRIFSGSTAQPSLISRRLQAWSVRLAARSRATATKVACRRPSQLIAGTPSFLR